MKTVTIFKNGENIEIPVIFSVFDVNQGLLTENKEYEAKNSRHALEQHLGHKNFKRSGDNYASYCVSKFFIEDGIRFRYGKRIWYA